MANIRLLKEIQDLTKNPPTNVTAGQVDDDLYHWRATIIGPEGTPYFGGVFYLDVHFPSDYPFLLPD